MTLITKNAVEAMQPPKNTLRHINKAMKRHIDWERRGVSPADMRSSGVDPETILWIFVRPDVLPPKTAKMTVVELLEKIVQDSGMANTVLMGMLKYQATIKQAKRFVFGEIDEGEFRAVYANADTDASYWRVKNLVMTDDRKEKIEQVAYLVTTYLMPVLTQAPNAAINAIRHLAQYINSYHVNAAAWVLNTIVLAEVAIEIKNVNASFGNELLAAEPADESFKIEELKEVEYGAPTKNEWVAGTDEQGSGLSGPAAEEIIGKLQAVDGHSINGNNTWTQGSNGSGGPIIERVVESTYDEQEGVHEPKVSLSLREKLDAWLSSKKKDEEIITPPVAAAAPVPAFDVSGMADEFEEPETPMTLDENEPEISLTPKRA